jgi:hypothetical protein
VGVTSSNDNEWLSKLADVEASRTTEREGPRTCPDLRTVTIRFDDLSVPPAYWVFNQLIRCRCIPIREIDDELYTEMGYKVLESLVLRFPRTQGDVLDIVELHSWTGAEVERISTKHGVKYRLRWSYKDFDP